MSEEKKPMKYYSNIQEKTLSEALGWKKIGGSGASPCAPGDIKASEWLGECKTHTKEANILFDANVWTKIKEEAYSHLKKPVLFVDNGTQKIKNTWCICLAKDINATQMIIADLPFTVRKNITFKNNDAAILLKTATEEFLQGEFYIASAFDYIWNGEKVFIMPFESFEKVYKK